MAAVSRNKFGFHYTDYKRRELILNTCTVLCITAMLGVELYFFTHYTTGDEESTATLQYQDFVVSGTIFIGLGLGFFLYGTLTMCTLKSYFINFYNKNRCSLIATTLLLGLPQLTRGMINLSRGLNKSIDTSICNLNSILFDIFFYSISFLVPVGT